MKKNYSFWTLFPIIFSSVVGIGSYFKIGKILNDVQGNATLAIITWVISIVVVLASTLVLIDMISDKESESIDGGLLRLIEQKFSSSITRMSSIYITHIYLPILVIIESIMASTFIFREILNIQSNQLIFASSLVLIFSFLLINTLSVKFSNSFEILSVIVKASPLIVLIIMGLIIFPIYAPEKTHLIESFKPIANDGTALSLIIKASPATLFALDGWQWIISLTGEVKGGSKTLIKTLLFSMIVISLFYILYTLGGLSVIEGKTWAYGNNGLPLAVSDVFTKIFNNKIFVQVINVFIVIAALSGLNAFSIIYVRQIKSGAKRGYLMFSKNLIKENKIGLNVNLAYYGAIYASLVFSIISLVAYKWPALFSMNKSNFDITYPINVLSEVWVVGLFSILFILLSWESILSHLSNKGTYFYKDEIYITLNIIMLGGSVFTLLISLFFNFILFIIGALICFVLFYASKIMLHKI